MSMNSESSKSLSIYYSEGDRVQNKLHGPGTVTRKFTSEDGERIVVHFDHGADIVFSPNGDFIPHHKNSEWDLTPCDYPFQETAEESARPVMTFKEWAFCWFAAGVCAGAGVAGMM